MAHRQRTFIVAGLAVLALAVAGVLTVLTIGDEGQKSPEPVTVVPPGSPARPSPQPEPPSRDPEADGPPAATAARPAVLSPELTPLFRLIEARRTGPARVRLRKHLLVNPDDGQAEFLFGLSYHREKKYEQARPYFRRAADLAPEYDPVHYFRGWGLYYLGEIEAARKSLERHLTYKPDYADTHFALGLIALDEDRLDDADRLFRRSIVLAGAGEETARERAKAHARLADVRIRQGDFEAAREQLIIATELFPDHYEAFYKLYRVHTRLGDEEAAADARTRFETTRARLYPNTRFPE
ncbi:MAG: tetratricopeptide repeat protein [Planctomycetes bacterium]|nr:tetratricopeptide repeat protein [Planctomycetota bacterium]